MAEVKWIKFMVGTFDGKSFRQIKRAKLKDGTPYRDRLTAVWFELLDLAAKYNNEGRLVKCDELAIDAEAQYEDIAIMIDREPEEVECCLKWYEAHGMIEIIDDVFLLSNWGKYQTLEGIAKVREQGKIRQQRHREKLKLEGESNDSNVTSRDITEKNKKENKNKEEEIDNNNCSNSVSSDSSSDCIINDFNAFWEIYPRKVGRLKCINWWKQHHPDSELTLKILVALKNQLNSIWANIDVKFIPHPYTWLNQGRWDDELDYASAEAADETGGFEAL